jgi:diacylglycerol kinase (CTP)
MPDYSSSALASRVETHLARKLWHVFTGVAGLTCFYSLQLTVQFTAIALLMIAFVGLVVDLLRLRFQGVNRLAILVMGPFMRESERQGFSGLPFYALGASLSLFFFPEPIAILSILFLVFADPIASYVGISFGTKKLWGSKTFEGFYGAYIVCFLLSLFYGLFSLPVSADLFIFSLFAGLIGATTELLATRIDDNLAIPVFSGLGLWFLNFFVTLY